VKKKIRILRIISSLDPKYGGPSKTIIDSSVTLNKQGFKVDILTNDNENSIFFKSKKINIINKGPGLGNYCFNLKLFFWLLKNRNNYDQFIIHGVWEFNTLMARILLKNKFYVFTHGQLDPFFRSQNIKKIKKKIYWNLVEKKNLIYSKSLLLTSENEKKLLNNTYVDTKNIKKTVIRYGINRPKFNKNKSIKIFYKKFPKLKNKRFLLFLGRFHEKKGCEILIKSAKKMLDNKTNIYILMAGPNNNYTDKLKVLANRYKLDNNIFWADIILKDLKWGAISASEGMVLSSHGENFGVSLAESLSCSRPVLTTDKVNIYREILNSRAGFISKNNVNSFYSILKKFNNLSKTNIKKMNVNSLNCFKKNFDLTLSKKSLGKFLSEEYNKN
jgi:glycosyltransferase involved in cell wall biosynthesis